MEFDRGTLFRSIALGMTLVNQMLVAYDFDPIPGRSEQFYDVISTIATVTVAIVTWFKNNYLTFRGKQQLKVLQREGLTEVKKVY